MLAEVKNSREFSAFEVKKITSFNVVCSDLLLAFLENILCNECNSCRYRNSPLKSFMFQAFSKEFPSSGRMLKGSFARKGKESAN